VQESDDREDKKPKYFELPPLPAKMQALIQQQQAEETKYSDPSKHQGRIRNFGHVPGNWPTHVYIKVHKSTTLLNVLQAHRAKVQLQTQQSDDWHWFPDNKATNVDGDSLHVSLSRTVALREHQIIPFVDKLRNTVEKEKCPNFAVSLGGIEWYTNDEKTRSFASLSCKHGRDQVCKLIEMVNSVFRVFDLPLYYKNPSPHATFGWSLGNVVGSRAAQQTNISQSQPDQASLQTNTEVPAAANCSDERSGTLDPTDLPTIEVEVGCICVNIGNKHYEINLTEKT